MFRLNVLLKWLPFVVLGALVAYVVIARPFDWNAVLNHITGLSAVLWVQLFGVFLLSYGARIWRWCLFTRVMGVSVPWWRNAVIYMAGFALGLVFHKAGEAMRVLYLRPYGMTYANGVGAFLADRLLDILVAGLLACSGIAMFTGHSDWALMATGVCLLAMWTLRSSLAREWVRRLPLGRLSSYAHEGMHAMSLLLSGRTLLRAGVLSAAVWCVQGTALYFMLVAMGSPVEWHLAVAVYAIGLFAGAAAIVPGGLGAAEATIVLLLISKGVDKEVAIAAAVLGRGVPQWAGMITGLLCLAMIGSATADAPLEPPPASVS
jgi:glycosyltransferase 2 family protein